MDQKYSNFGSKITQALKGIGLKYWKKIFDLTKILKLPTSIFHILTTPHIIWMICSPLLKPFPLLIRVFWSFTTTNQVSSFQDEGQPPTNA